MSILKELAGSKKFAALVLGLIVAILSRVGLSPDLAQPVAELATALVVAYIASQGLADHGKERAKVEGKPVATVTVSEVK